MNDQPYGGSQGRSSQPTFAVADIGIDDRDLRVEMFTLCDGATEQEGRLSLLGTYDVVHAAQFPCLLPQVTVVLRLRFWPHESRMHRLRLMLTGPDGETIADTLEIRAEFQPFSEELSSACNAIIRLPSVRIEEPGEYTLDFYLNGTIEGRLPVRVCLRGTPL